MDLQEGKYYADRQGQVRGPLIKDAGVSVRFYTDDDYGFHAWTHDGYDNIYRRPSQLDLVEEAACAKLHSLQKYLDGLVWDKTPRINTWMENVFGVAESDYNQAVAAKFLIASVAHAMRPEFHQVPPMMILAGKSGIGKTIAVIELLPKFPWYIVEVEEIFGDINRRLSDATKKQHPCPCVLIGTTNASELNLENIKDMIFWPVRCLKVVNRDYLQTHRDQLWAEAVHRFNAGEDWCSVPSST